MIQFILDNMFGILAILAFVTLIVVNNSRNICHHSWTTITIPDPADNSKTVDLKKCRFCPTVISSKYKH